MPRYANNSTTAAIPGGANKRNGELRVRWSFSYEFAWQNGTPNAAGQAAARSSASTDELGALLDKALAFAG